MSAHSHRLHGPALLQLGAKDEGIGSVERVVGEGGGGSGRHHGGVWEYNFNLQLHLIV